jgi:hypothetical protein
VVRAAPLPREDAAEWAAKVETISDERTRIQVGCIIYWRMFSEMLASERVDCFDKWTAAWWTCHGASDPDVERALLKIGIDKFCACEWSRSPVSAVQGSVVRDRLTYQRRVFDRPKLKARWRSKKKEIFDGPAALV